MPIRVVKNALIRWQDPRTGGRRVAFQGQEVDLPVEIVAKLGTQLHPEGWTPGGVVEPVADGGLPVDLDLAPVEDAAAWLRGEHGETPKASEVVAAANGDVDRAELLIEAEKSLEGDPRKSVVGPLQKIIDGG